MSPRQFISLLLSSLLLMCINLPLVLCTGRLFSTPFSLIGADLLTLVHEVTA